MYLESFLDELLNDGKAGIIISVGNFPVLYYNKEEIASKERGGGNDFDEWRYAGAVFFVR